MRTSRVRDALFRRFFVENWKGVLFAMIIFLCVSVISYAMECNEDDVNPAFKAICDIYILATGRITRGLSVIVIMTSAWGIMSSGKINWQELLQLSIGFGLFFFPKTVVLFFLPATVTGISGGQFNASTIYTPDEIMSCICKAIM